MRYNNRFYKNRNKGGVINSLSSAEEIVPILMEVIEPKSVIDIGCATGTWLSEFKKNGVKDIKGIDGPWVDKKNLIIENGEFLRCDIEKDSSIFKEVQKKYDLLICLECAEHLNENVDLLRKLMELSDIILFSAAIPNQGGVHHINEQFQAYWINRFEKHNFVAIDFLRKRIWNNPKVKYFYKQNTFLYVNRKVLKNNQKLLSLYELNKGNIYNIVHPELYMNAIHPDQKLNYILSVQFSIITSLAKKLIYKLMNIFCG